MPIGWDSENRVALGYSVGVLGSDTRIGGVVRGHALQHKGKTFNWIEEYLKILERCFPLATPYQALESQQVFLLEVDQA